MVRLAAMLVAAALLAMPATALAATAEPNPFLPQPAPREAQEPVPAPQPAPAPVQEDTGDVGGGTALLIAFGIVGLLGGIWYVISRDAKRATQGRVRDPLAVPQGRSATRASPKSRKVSAAERKRRKRGRAR